MTENEITKVRSIIIQQIEFLGNCVLSGEYVSDQMCGYSDTVTGLIMALCALEKIHQHASF